MKEYYSVKEIADKLAVSKTTVQNAIKALKFEADKQDTQRKYYGADKAKAICDKIKPPRSTDKPETKTAEDTDKPATQTAQSTDQPTRQTDNTPANQQNTAQKTDTPTSKTEQPENSSELELLRSVIKTLQDQIAIKDKQIEDYSARLAEAMALTRGQQAIHAADKVAELTAPDDSGEVVEAQICEDADRKADTEAVTGETPKKRSFWARLFG